MWWIIILVVLAGIAIAVANSKRAKERGEEIKAVKASQD